MIQLWFSLVQCWFWWISVGSGLLQFGSGWSWLVHFWFSLGGSVLVQFWFRCVHIGLCWLNFGFVSVYFGSVAVLACDHVQAHSVMTYCS